MINQENQKKSLFLRKLKLLDKAFLALFRNLGFSIGKKVKKTIKVNDIREN
ncbi:MAG: hypothetical protein GTN76_16545 [Candidatus Aenigmarchaeota archaeon]|nr:hypothetical protein [Candidatus Aenigmarchaeota archaeon]